MKGRKFPVTGIGAAGSALALAAVGMVAVGGSADLGAAPVAGAQEQCGPFPDVVPEGDTYSVPGDRDGPSEFPIVRYEQVLPKQPGVMDFEHYHTTREMAWWMCTWAQDHPDIVELYEVGESFGGQTLQQLTITNKETGQATDKPAAYFEGGRHSGEITSSESAFWLAWKLITGYGEDPDITRLVDEKAIYIRPQNNPDGSDMYLFTAQANRSSIRPHDTDGDGLLDEDPGEDLNDDGYVTEMREYVGEGNGTHVIDDRDPAGNAMRRVGDGNGDYILRDEGIDDDGDGGTDEDGVGGLDLHRNYPYNWRPEASAEQTGRGHTQRGAGEYPLSEPETRTVFSFLLSHPNVGVVNSMDTRVPMHLRGPSTCEASRTTLIDPSECVYESDLQLLEHFDEVGVSITDYPYSGDTYRDYATRGGNTEPGPLFGHGPDFGYFQFGSVWYGDELWNNGRFEDYDGDGSYAEWEISRWCFETGRDDCFLQWQEFDHPDLGAVEIGGINPKFWAQNGAPDVLEPWARRQGEFNLYLTRSLPQVQIVDTRLRELGNQQRDGATHELHVTVENTGRIPTALEMAKQVKIVRPDTVGVELPNGSGTTVGQAPQLFLGGGKRDTATVRIRLANPDSPPPSVTVRALSTRGGVDERTIPWESR